MRVPDRRLLLAVLAALAATVSSASPGSALGAETAAGSDPCAAAVWRDRLVAAGEPGEPLQVSGTVFQPDGVTPAAGVIVYAYQTDASGHYARLLRRSPRIRGWMRIGKDGRYEFRTIRPGPYPNRTTEAHIHTQLWGPGAPPQWGPDLLFADDPLLPDAKRRESEALGRFAFVKSPVRRDDGVFETTLDIRLKKTGDRFESNILHGVTPCGVKPLMR